MKISEVERRLAQMREQLGDVDLRVTVAPALEVSLVLSDMTARRETGQLSALVGDDACQVYGLLYQQDADGGVWTKDRSLRANFSIGRG